MKLFSFPCVYTLVGLYAYLIIKKPLHTLSLALFHSIHVQNLLYIVASDVILFMTGQQVLIHK